MKANERLMTVLNKAIENRPDIELGKFIRYMTSGADFAYMSDTDISEQIEGYNRLCESFGTRQYNYQFDATDIHYYDEALLTESEFHKLYDFTKENEQIAYDRYKAEMRGRVFFSLVEKLDLCDFLKRFSLVFVEADDYKGISVINHRDNFLNTLPSDYKHMKAYTICRKGDKYVAMHKYAVKFPCFGEMLDCITFDFCSGFDECFSIAIDWAESPRFTEYTKHIWYGAAYRPAKKEIEIYNTNQTIEIFHELMQKSNKVINERREVIYDDGTMA